MNASVTSLGLSASAFALLVASGRSAAQCDFYRSFVPDFDQRRLQDPPIPGLPNDGAMYCVPTAVCNWLAYIANRGIPSAFGGRPGNWQAQGNYNFVTSQIALMGTLMGTSPGGGTNGEGGWTGAWLWGLSRCPGKYTVSHYWCGGNWGCPTPFNLWLAHVSGGLITAMYGRYTEDAPGFYTRSGGHAISVNGLEDGCTSHARIAYRNPWTSAANTIQATFGTSWCDVRSRTAFFRWSDGAGYSIASRPRLTSLDGNKFLDGWLVIYPTQALTSSPLDGDSIDIVRPITLDGSDPPPVIRTPNPAPGAILDMAMAPDMFAYYFITARTQTARPRLYHVDPATGAPTLLLEGSNYRRLCFSRQGDLYILDGSILRKFDVGASPPEELRSTTPPHAIAAMAYDDGRDELVLVTGTLPPRLMRYTRNLGQESDLAFPPGLTLEGDVSAAVDPTDGNLWVAGEGRNRVYQLFYAQPNFYVVETIDLPNQWGPTGLNADEQGHVYFVANGKAREYMKSGQLWVRAPGSAWDGRDMGRHFYLSRSRTNHDPAQHEGPSFTPFPADLPPEELDCPADCDSSTGRRVLDVFDFLCFQNKFAVRDAYACTCDESTGPNVCDVFDFLCFQNAFAGGCP